MTTEHPKATHHGRNVKRFREMSKLKQEDLAELLGGAWTQKKLSQLEARETIEEELLEEVAKALKVPVEAIKEYSEESVFYAIQNNYEGAKSNTQSPNQSADNYYNCTFNPLDELMEAHKQIAKLNAALLKEKDEKIALLKSIRKKK
jgi:transcriptional regulator with XRE-family HTH domain